MSNRRRAVEDEQPPIQAEHTPEPGADPTPEPAAPVEPVSAFIRETTWSGMPNFECTSCGFASLDRGNAEAHVRIHDPELPGVYAAPR